MEHFESAVNGAIAHALRRYGDRIVHIIDDARSEAWVAVLTARESIESAADPAAYAFVVARNAVMRYCRREMRQNAAVQGVGTDPVEHVYGHQPVLHHDTTDVRDRLAAVCRDRIDAAILRFREERRTLAEIGEILGLSRGAVSKRLSRIAKIMGLPRCVKKSKNSGNKSAETDSLLMMTFSEE